MQNDTSFQQMMKQMEHQMRQDQDAFVYDNENDKRIHISDPHKALGETFNTHAERMLHRIGRVDNYTWNRDENGGIDTGFTDFNESVDGGLQPGLILFGAAPNVGKSAFMLQMMKQISRLNENVYCEYHSRDDSIYELMPRYIACDQHITISQAKNPKKYADDEEIMRLRNEGLKNLYRYSDRFVMMDAEESPQTIEALEDHIKDLRMNLPEGTRIVLGIDSFYDLQTDKKFGGNQQEEIKYIAKTLKQYAQTYDLVVMCTAHLRKTGNKRPINDDLKENNVIEYEANLLCLMYNEVGIKEEGADIHWISEDSEKKMPVVEVRFSKNKMDSYKGTRFFEFIPEQSLFIQSSEEASKRYSSLIYQ